MEQYSDSIYSVTEEIDKEEIEFLLDMHLFLFKRKYNIFAVNIPPFFSKEARRKFAIMVLGQNEVLDLQHYLQ